MTFIKLFLIVLGFFLVIGEFYWWALFFFIMAMAPVFVVTIVGFGYLFLEIIGKL